MLTDGIAELTLEVCDMDVLERFYVDVLGLDVLSRQDDRVWLACGQHTRLGLWLPGRKE
jgi:catechol-2,3-dioxygenase